MEVTFSREELSTLSTLLSKEESDLKIEIHHTRNRDYRECLKEKEKEIAQMLTRIERAARVPSKIYAG